MALPTIAPVTTPAATPTPTAQPQQRASAGGAANRQETGGSIMRHLFVVPWLTPSRRTLHGIAVVAILVFGFFAILKSTSGGREAPAKELVTGSIPRAASVP